MAAMLSGAVISPVPFSSLNFNVPQMNLDLASLLGQLRFDIDSKELFDLAWEKALASGYASETDKVEICVGLPTASDYYLRGYELLKDECNGATVAEGFNGNNLPFESVFLKRRLPSSSSCPLSSA